MKSLYKEKDEKLDNLALVAVTGSFFNEETQREEHIIDELVFEEILVHVELYIKRSVFNSCKRENPDLVNRLRWEVFKLLKDFGPTPMNQPFHISFKLRISNILTNAFNKKIRVQKKAPTCDVDDINILPEIKKYTEIETNQCIEKLLLCDTIEKMKQRLPEREKKFVTVFLEEDGDFEKISERLNKSQCYIRKVLRRIKDNRRIMVEVFER